MPDVHNRSLPRTGQLSVAPIKTTGSENYRCVSVGDGAEVVGDGLTGWFAILTDRTDPNRYEDPAQGTPFEVHFIREVAELKEPGLSGVVFDSSLRGWKRDALFSLACKGVPIMVGPGAKSARSLIWAMKPGIEAAGGIFEIATDYVDFKERLSSVLRAAALRGEKDSALEPEFRVSTLVNPGMQVLNYWSGDVFGSISTLWDTLTNRSEVTQTPNSILALPGVRAATNDLRDPKTGRLDAELIRQCFGLKRAELAKLLGVSAEALRQTPCSAKHQDTLALFEAIAALRTLLADPADFAKWLESPNPELADKKPADLIRGSRAGLVADLVQDILTNRGR